MRLAKGFAASLAIVAAHAHGMTLSSHGVGQVLIYPYYTVNNHQQTVFSFTNATTQGKALQMTFREGYDGRAVYAQRVYLGPNQSWSANVFALSDIGVNDDGVGIATSDHACVQTLTDPATKTMPSGLAYHAFDTASYTATNSDGGPTSAARAREGFFEVIELGELAGDTATVILPQHPPAPDCTVVVPYVKMIADLGSPTGGLSGSAAVINVAQGTFFGFEPKAIDGFRAQRIVPPALADLGMAGDEAKDTVIASIEYRGAYLNATFPRRQAIDAVSALFMSTVLTGDFDTTSNIGAATDWVLTFPTKQYYVDKTPPGPDLRPFEKKFSDDPAGSSHVQSYYSMYSRDGYDIYSNWCGFGECPRWVPDILFQTHVISFHEASDAKRSDVLGSGLVTFAPVQPDNTGTANVEFTGRLNDSNEGYEFVGLPVIGVQAINYVNDNVAGGVLSNYSGTASLRATLNCDSDTGCR